MTQNFARIAAKKFWYVPAQVRRIRFPGQQKLAGNQVRLMPGGTNTAAGKETGGSSRVSSAVIILLATVIIFFAVNLLSSYGGYFIWPEILMLLPEVIWLVSEIQYSRRQFTRYKVDDEKFGAVIRCPGCGMPVTAGTKICPGCGMDLTDAAARAAAGAPSGETWNSAAGSSAGENVTCPQCGNVFPRYMSFCPRCGARNGAVRSSAPIMATVGKVCGGPFFLILCLLLSGDVVCSLLGGINLVGLLFTIPLILICVGCWSVFTQSHNKQALAKGTGFTLIQSGLITFLIVFYVVFFVIIMYFAVELTHFAEAFDRDRVDSVVYPILIILLILFFVIFIFAGSFINGISRTAVSARSIMRGEAVEWKTSVYSMIVLGVVSVFSLSRLSSVMNRYNNIRNMVDSLLKRLSIFDTISFLRSQIVNLIMDCLERIAPSFLHPENQTVVVVSLALLAVTMIWTIVVLYVIRQNNSEMRGMN